MAYKGPLAITEVGLTAEEAKRARLPEKPKNAGDPHQDKHGHVARSYARHSPDSRQAPN